MKTALITGITGQDGSYLAELLLEKDAACAPDEMHNRAAQSVVQTSWAQNFVVDTSHPWSMQRLRETAFGAVELDYRDDVVEDPKFMRPAEVDLLVVDPSNVKHGMGWEPQVSFQRLIEMIAGADLVRHRARG